MYKLIQVSKVHYRDNLLKSPFTVMHFCAHENVSM